jgi:hypothetical protein
MPENAKGNFAKEVLKEHALTGPDRAIYSPLFVMTIGRRELRDIWKNFLAVAGLLIFFNKSVRLPILAPSSSLET